MSIAVFGPPEKIKSSFIAEQADRIATKIEDVSGIPTIGYKRGPVGMNICIFSINSNALRIWPGAAQVDLIDANEKKKQVVFSIKEETRQIKVKHKAPISGATYHDGCWRDYSGRPINIETFKNQLFDRNNKMTKDFLANAVGLALPTKTKYSYEIQGRYTEEITRQNGMVVHSLYDYIEITAKIPAMNMYVLAGYDESALFICELPKAVESFEEACDSLMPKEVKLAFSYKRQGEWFFVPVSQKESSQIDNLLQGATSKGKLTFTHERNSFGLSIATKPYSVAFTGSRGKDFTYYANGSLENGSSHHAASLLVTKDAVYVCGAVIDGRENHHRPLFLSEWHRAYRNLEVVPNLKEMNSQRRRYWD